MQQGVVCVIFSERKRTTVSVREVGVMTISSKSVVRGGKTEVVLADSRVPRLECCFTYALLKNGLALREFSVRRRATWGNPDLRSIRRYLLDWERIARSAASEKHGPPPASRELAAWIRQRFPDLAAAARRGDGRAKRSLEARLRLARVAREYRHLVQQGVKDPAARIATAHGAKGNTVRAWIFRARKDGLLEPPPGPTSGEVSAVWNHPSSTEVPLPTGRRRR
jgi:hypothetical protein